MKGNRFHRTTRLVPLAGLLLLSRILYSQELSTTSGLQFDSVCSNPAIILTVIASVSENGEPVVAGTFNFMEGDSLLGSLQLTDPSGTPVAGTQSSAQESTESDSASAGLLVFPEASTQAVFEEMTLVVSSSPFGDFGDPGDDGQPILLALADPTGENVPDFVMGAGVGASLLHGNPKTPLPEALLLPRSPTGQQTKRIMGIVPNFEAVSANAHLPPLSLKEKFWLSTENTFDYSSFISVGMQAAIEQARHTYPEFHEGAAAYGRYYWHTYADLGIENYLVGAIFPAITHEDPRYYTLDQGQVRERMYYAISRLWITRSDAKASTFNFSEIFGSGVSAAVSSRYYPREARGSGQTLERWASQLINDGVGNVIQEFWPDIHQKLFKRH